ncbi:MAG: STAS domain-containing protein [Roseivirga sp.]|nr:STAS domain-containing protein [Roseivirga sp.]
MIEISKTTENNYLLISVEGEADASSSLELDRQIRESFEGDVKNILVDCTNLNYISSAGLGVFMSYIEEVNEKAIIFIIFGLSDKVSKVFGILGLDQLLTIKQTKEDALAEINGL